MNVSCSYKLYIHTIYESYVDIEWLKITKDNVLFKDSKYVTHVIPIKKIVDFCISK